MPPKFFKTFALLWCWPTGIFSSANKSLGEIRTISKEKAVEYFRKSYPKLNDDGYEKHANGSLIMAEQIEIN